MKSVSKKDDQCSKSRLENCQDLNCKDGNKSIYIVRFQPPKINGNMIATGGENKTINLCNFNPSSTVDTKKVVTRKTKLRDSIKALSFSTDGQLLAVAGGEAALIRKNEHTINVWKVETLQSPSQENSRPGFSFKAHTSLIRSLSFNSDRVLASGSHDKTIMLWDLKHCKSDQCPPIQNTDFKHDGWITSVSFNPDDNKILASSSGDSTVKLWDIKDKKLILTLSGHTDSVTNVSWSLDGKILASGSYDKTIKLWDIDLELDSLIQKGCDWIHNYLINAKRQDQHLCDGVRKINLGH